MSDELSCN